MQSDGGSRWFGWAVGMVWKSRLSASKDGGEYMGPDGSKVTPYPLKREYIAYIAPTFPKDSRYLVTLRYKSSGCPAPLSLYPHLGRFIALWAIGCVGWKTLESQMMYPLSPR